MWLTIISSLLPFALKVLGIFFEKAQVSKDQRQAFLNFLSVMQNSQNTPAKMKESYAEQIKRLEAETPLPPVNNGL